MLTDISKTTRRKVHFPRFGDGAHEELRIGITSISIQRTAGRRGVAAVGTLQQSN